MKAIIIAAVLLTAGCASPVEPPDVPECQEPERPPLVPVQRIGPVATFQTAPCAEAEAPARPEHEPS